jgi:CHAD domain-containing protein/CYTH domain-containing protein
MRLDAEVIDRTAGEGARLVALALLAEADEAAARLEGGADPEALHDYRVALRRLRTTLRAFRPWLEASVGRRDERRVKKAAALTNPARDAEVQLAWLRAQEPGTDGRRRAGLEYLRERIGERAADGAAPADVVARHRRLARRLAPRLEVYEENLRADAPGATFGAALAGQLRAQLAALRDRIEAISGPADEATAHRARIEGKRLRYLLEPLRGNPHADAREAVGHLKVLQDVLGELHDAHVLGAELGRALVDAAAESARRLHAQVYAEPGGRGAGRAPSPRPGLVALARRARERRDALHASLRAELARGTLEAISADVEGIAAALERRAGGALETERKYRLAAVPPRALEREPLEISQGWLPGERFRERVRRVRGAGGERWFRALKQGTGLRRLEAEEETSREVFETLWPLTEGRRVEKRRFRVEDGGLVWEIDEFTDRELVLAEVELPAAARDAPLPGWLAPHVVQEVTGDAAYLNENLGAGAGAVPARAGAEPRAAGRVDGGVDPSDARG